MGDNKYAELVQEWQRKAKALETITYGSDRARRQMSKAGVYRACAANLERVMREEAEAPDSVEHPYPSLPRWKPGSTPLSEEDALHCADRMGKESRLLRAGFIRTTCTNEYCQDGSVGIQACGTCRGTAYQWVFQGNNPTSTPCSQ